MIVSQWVYFNECEWACFDECEWVCFNECVNVCFMIRAEGKRLLPCALSFSHTHWIYWDAQKYCIFGTLLDFWEISDLFGKCLGIIGQVYNVWGNFRSL